MILQVSKTDNNISQAFKDNVVLDYAGVNASEFSSKQRSQLLDLIAEYVTSATHTGQSGAFLLARWEND
ncbi:MAG: DUF3500 domain-containing protein [Gammaproteobacteria bacterium]